VTASVATLILLGVLTLLLLGSWRLSLLRHHARIDGLQVRVHVNGIRGKSSVTRLLAAVLREGGYQTVAKTTGSAARIIGTAGEETPIRRRGAPTITEQVDIIRKHVNADVDALVIECMAVRPLYQQFSQDSIVRSDITVITNVREDHQEEMGETLEEIADSMSLTIPRGGLLITAEERPWLRERLRRNAERIDCRFMYADPRLVLPSDLKGFDYVQFPDNVAIGLALAAELGIDRRTALRGMLKAVPDAGAVRLETYRIGDKRVLWVPLFAANDRESVVASFELLRPLFPAGAPVVGILNNRLDRGRRAELFAEMVTTDLAEHLDEVVTFGAYEETVSRTILKAGFPREKLHNLGADRNPTLEELLDELSALFPGDEGVLVGMVNIHTPQAEMLMEYFAESGGWDAHQGMHSSLDPARMPAAARRTRRATGRPRGISRDA